MSRISLPAAIQLNGETIFRLVPRPGRHVRRADVEEASGLVIASLREHGDVSRTCRDAVRRLGLLVAA